MTASAPLRPVKEIEHFWITLADGCRLSARLWLPEDAADSPVPVVFEFLPYRKRDGTFERDEIFHPQLAARGFACLRVDMRGNGESDGLMFDEYTEQEQSDGCEVIAWAAEQPWSNGKVGMIGISWGGFNGLQIAARRPPALAGVVTICFTDDRYADDIHYRGGCLLNDNLLWSQQMAGYSSRSPDPALLENSWSEVWLERLENLPFLLDNWLRHQRRDDFWKWGSICEDFSAVQVPVLAVGGWADAYTNTVFRVLEGLQVPVQGLIGPWVHKYPQIAWPEPRIDFVSEVALWFDRWLKGIENGAEKRPKLRAYIQESVRPKSDYAERPGRWVAEETWPSPNLTPQTLHLSAHGLSEEAGEAADLTLTSPADTGLEWGRFCPGIRNKLEMPLDQRPDDGRSLVFDSAPLAERMELLGAPEVELEIRCDQAQGQLCVRLCDLHPDGASKLVSIGMLNLTHRDSHEFPEPLVPGETYRIRIKLDDCGYAIPAGHRLRVAVSTAYWPLLWPSPKPLGLTLVAGRSSMTLPVRPLREEPEVSFAPPPPAGGPFSEKIRPPKATREVHRDVESGIVEQRWLDDVGRKKVLSNGMIVDQVVTETFRIRPDDPLSAETVSEWRYELARESGWKTVVESRSRMTADETHFHIEQEAKAYDGDQEVFAKIWRESIPRDQV